MTGIADTAARCLGYEFRHPDILLQALTHSSAITNPADKILSNERLEFLGDRVLGLLVARMLFERFPDEEEGPLARRHAALVQRQALVRVAEKAKIGSLLIIADSEAASGGRENPSILADACEALIAALYLDGGLEAAERFVERYWESLADETPAPPIDAKTALQEWAQAKGLPLPNYYETGRTGPSHAPVFTLEVSIEGFEPTSASGPSKRAAEQAAAEQMLNQVERPPAKR
jgi:ribonuclease III